MRNGNVLKSRVSEICIKRIHVNQGVGVTVNCGVSVIFETIKDERKNKDYERITQN